MADIAFQQSQPAAGDADLKRLAQLAGFPLPTPVADHYRHHNGGVPSLTAWELPSGEMLVVSEFLPVTQPGTGDRSILSTLELVRERGLLRPGLVPFALDWGGNYLSFDADGAVYFSAMDAWRSERTREENIEKTTSKLTDSFADFIGRLESDPDA